MPPFLQDDQARFTQVLLIGLVLHPPDSRDGPLLNLLKFISFFFSCTGGPKQITVLPIINGNFDKECLKRCSS